MGAVFSARFGNHKLGDSITVARRSTWELLRASVGRRGNYSGTLSAAGGNAQVLLRPPKGVLGHSFVRRIECPGTPSTAERSTRALLRPPEGVLRSSFGRQKEYQGTPSAAGRSAQVLLRPPEGVPGYSFSKTTRALLLWKEYLNSFSGEVPCWAFGFSKSLQISTNLILCVLFNVHKLLFATQSLKNLPEKHFQTHFTNQRDAMLRSLHRSHHLE